MRSDKMPMLALLLGLGAPTVGLPGQDIPGQAQTQPPAAEPAPMRLAQAPEVDPQPWDDESAEVQARNELMERTVREIQGEGVYNPQGEKIGSIDAIARNLQDRSVSAVISVGGFLGLGASEVAVPLGELRLEEERVVISTAITADELKSQPAYEPGQYEELDRDLRLAEAEPTRGAEYGSGPSISFEDLDSDGDGYISKEEAADHPEVIENWQRYDTDRDGRLDEAEFSAFESDTQMK